MNSVFLESRTGVVRQNVSTALRLTEGGRKTGHYARVISLVPEGGLTVHWRHDVHLKIYKYDQKIACEPRDHGYKLEADKRGPNCRGKIFSHLLQVARGSSPTLNDVGLDLIENFRAVFQQH